MKRKSTSTSSQKPKKSAPSQQEEPKDIALWTKVFSDVPKAVLVKAVAESIMQLPQLQQVILPKLEKAISQTEDVKKHMKVLDVGTISKNLGEYYSSFAQEMKHNWHDMWEEQGEEMEGWQQDVQQIFDAVYALCIDKKTAVGEYEKAINALTEVWRQVQRLNSLKLRISTADMMENLEFTIGETTEYNFLDAFWKMYALVLEKAQSDPQTPKETFQQWTKEATKMDTGGRMYSNAQHSKSPLFKEIADSKLSKFKSKPSFEEYQTLVSKNANAESINELLNILEKHAKNSYPREDSLAIKCMLFSNQIDRAIKFADSMKAKKDLDPVAAQLIMRKVIEETKSAKPSIKINASHIDWCVDTLGAMWKDFRDSLLQEIFSAAEDQFEDEMHENAPADFSDKEQEKLFEALSEASSKSRDSGGGFGFFGGYSSDEFDEDDDDGFVGVSYGGASYGGGNKTQLSDTYSGCASLFKDMKSIPQFPQKKLDAIRKDILYTREQALESLVFLDAFQSMWDYEWNHSSKYQHLADACEVLLQDNKELIDQLKKEGNAKQQQLKPTMLTFGKPFSQQKVIRRR